MQKFKFWHFWERPLFEISEYAFNAFCSLTCFVLFHVQALCNLWKRRLINSSTTIILLNLFPPFFFHTYTFNLNSKSISFSNYHPTFSAFQVWIKIPLKRNGLLQEENLCDMYRPSVPNGQCFGIELM